MRVSFFIGVLFFASLSSATNGLLIVSCEYSNVSGSWQSAGGLFYNGRLKLAVGEVLGFGGYGDQCKSGGRAIGEADDHEVTGRAGISYDYTPTDRTAVHNSKVLRQGQFVRIYDAAWGCGNAMYVATDSETSVLELSQSEDEDLVSESVIMFGQICNRYLPENASTAKLPVIQLK